MGLSRSIGSAGILILPWRESERMRQWMITDVICSRFRRRLDSYERDTRKRHPMHSDIASAGSKRLVGIDPLDDEHDEGIGNLWTGIVANLHD
jgi:hypothetical protein